MPGITQDLNARACADKGFSVCLMVVVLCRGPFLLGTLLSAQHSHNLFLGLQVDVRTEKRSHGMPRNDNIRQDEDTPERAALCNKLTAFDIREPLG